MTQQELAEIVLRYRGQGTPGLHGQASNLTGGTLKTELTYCTLGLPVKPSPAFRPLIH